MTDVAGPAHWVPVAACTLPTAQQPLRVAEFGQLFATALRRIERPEPGRLRLTLAGDARERVADLVARESACCSFFAFAVRVAGAEVLLDVLVPAERTGVLDGLARQAGASLCEGIDGTARG